VPYQYLGYETRTYVQYLVEPAGTTLIADPGGSYDMAPAGSWVLPVPPADGLWETAEDEPDGEPEDGSEPDAIPALLLTAASTEDEGN
jgi:hypothetical protein